MVGDGLEDELGGRLLWESVPAGEIQIQGVKNKTWPPL